MAEATQVRILVTAVFLFVQKRVLNLATPKIFENLEIVYLCSMIFYSLILIMQVALNSTLICLTFKVPLLDKRYILENFETIV